MTGAKGPVPQLAIIGGGFSGVAVAYQLLKHARHPMKVHLISNGPFGRGMAYGTPSPHHMLNVPAGRMGIDPQDEGGFVQYLQSQGLPFKGEHFVPRSLYGAYLEWCLGHAQGRAQPRGVQLQLHRAQAIAIEPLEAANSTDGYRVLLRADDAAPVHIDADRGVVLALGNFPPVWPSIQVPSAWAAPDLIGNPWAVSRLAPADLGSTVMLLGSGLTAFDAVLQLRHEGHYGPIIMLSRRGMLAQQHRLWEGARPNCTVDVSVLLEGHSHLRPAALLRGLRELVHRSNTNGLDWRDVVAALRPITPTIWARLGQRGRGQFLRHLLPYWDTHRHRAAVPIAQAIDRERRAGTLHVQAGRLISIERKESGFEVMLQPRAGHLITACQVSRVINCTGPSSQVHRSEDELVRGMVANGQLKADPLGLGLEVTDEYELVNRDGIAQQMLCYVGPLLKSKYWEATAVPELRWHASRLVERIA